MTKKLLLPLKISLGYQNIKVSLYEFIENEQGVYLSDKEEIRIQKDLSGIETLNTFLHESLHAIIYTYGIKTEFKNDEHEERVVNTLGNGLTELLRRNPVLTNWMQEQV